MPQTDFTLYLKFFQYLDGQMEFDIDGFKRAFERFRQWVKGETLRSREYIRDPEALLQFFYDVNVIGYKEAAEDDSEIFHHWAYRERSLNNIAPKVKVTAKFMLNPGIAKALDIGKQMSTIKESTSSNRPRSGPGNPGRKRRNRRR